MQKRLLNRVPDAPDHRDKLLRAAAAPVVTEVDFRHLVPYIKDQGQEGSCTGHGIGSHYELMVRLHKSELPLSVKRDTIRLAPQFLYAQERKLDGDFSDDAGSSLRSGFEVMDALGCCLESDDPYSDKNLFVEPTAAMLAAAKPFRFDDRHRIVDGATAKSVLRSGYSFAIGIDVYQQFESDEAAETGLIRMPPPRATPIGGHCEHVVGASDSAKAFDQVGCYIVQNSYGPDWGLKGYELLPYAYVDQLLSTTDMWVGHFGKWEKPAAMNVAVSK